MTVINWSSKDLPKSRCNLAEIEKCNFDDFINFRAKKKHKTIFKSVIILLEKHVGNFENIDKCENNEYIMENFLFWQKISCD